MEEAKLLRGKEGNKIKKDCRRRSEAKREHFLFYFLLFIFFSYLNVPYFILENSLKASTISLSSESLLAVSSGLCFRLVVLKLSTKSFLGGDW